VFCGVVGIAGWLDVLDTVKKYFQDLLSQHFFFCQINLNNLLSSDNLLF